MTRARARSLPADPVWSALLHVANGQPQAKAPGFLLSLPAFSLDAEMAATLRALYGDAAAVCRFPARYLWLRDALDIPPLPIETCADLTEFKARAPADTLTLVFASENLAQPSSMMGHILLKLAGRNAAGEPVEHAVSFITDTTGVNLAQLFFESMVVGKEGFFTLAPYEEKVDLYLRREQRSLWEYDLSFSVKGKALVVAHLIELKQTRLTYLFQRYNCATVIDFILAIGAGRSLPVPGLWLTPKDVPKRAMALDIVGGSRIQPPSRWMIHALIGQLDGRAVAEARQAVDQMAPLPPHGGSDAGAFLRDQLALSYLAFRRESGTLQGDAVRHYAAELAGEVERRHPGKGLASEAFKDPVNAPQDSQVSLRHVRTQGDNQVGITLTPASHSLSSDNRTYFAETELLLFEAALLHRPRTGSTRVERFTLYGAKSLVPRNALSGGISGAFRMGAARRPDVNFRDSMTAFIEGAVGATVRPLDDVDLYALAGLGVSHQSGRTRLNALPEFGVIVRQVFDMKAIASVELRKPTGPASATYRKMRFTQAKYFGAGRWTLLLQMDWERQGAERRRTSELAVSYLF